MPRIPESLKTLLRGHEVEAFFDYDRGEDQWFDALKGVGSPGYPASVEVTKLINAFGVEIPLDTIHEVELENMEQQLIDQIVKIESEGEAADAEAYYDQLQEDKLLAKDGEV